MEKNNDKEFLCKIDNMGRVKISTAILDELELEPKDDLAIKIDNGIITLSKKITLLICLP